MKIINNAFNFTRCLFLMTLCACASVQGTDVGPRTLVLVHGANFDSSSWSLLVEQVDDVETYAVNLPGRKVSENYSKYTLNVMAKHLCSGVRRLSGNIDFLLHSQAGAVFNQMLRYCPEVKIGKVIYLAAVSPKAGEKPFDLLSKADEGNYFAGIDYIKEQGELRVVRENDFLSSFSQDANDFERKFIIKNAVSEPSIVAENILDFDTQRLNDIEKYYIYTTKDKIISLQSQKKIAKRMNVTRSFVLDSGHLPMITKTRTLIKILKKIL